MSVEYWVTCALDPWPSLEADEAFSEIVEALRSDGEYTYDAVSLTLQDAAPSFVPPGSVVVHVSGRPGAEWDEVMEFLDAMAAAGDGVVFSEDRQVVLDRRSVRPGVKAFKERPDWAVALGAKWPRMTVVVFATLQPKHPRAELEAVGLRAIAKRVDDRGFWNQSRFGDVWCESVPHGPTFDGLCKDAKVDPKPYIMCMRFSRVGAGEWTDALVAAQILAHAVKGRAIALGPDGATEDLPR